VADEQMISRDRYHQAGAEPARDERADDQPSAAADQEKVEGLEVYGDSAYGTGEARAAYRAGGHDTVIKPKPLRPAVAGGFTLDNFGIDEENGTVTCPGGHTRSMSANGR
jgi:hypothetical protein